MEDEQQWQRLIDEQTVLFRNVVQRNAGFAKRVAELEQELAVWKIAFGSADEERNTLKKKVTRLERSIGSLKDDNPLVICLIDGDGNIFSGELVSQGRAGGSQAAQLITKGIIDYLSESEDGKAESSSSISGRVQIWVSVFCNKVGLQETLTSRQFCTAEQFESFIMGFNQASPLFLLADVGSGKEAADAKIKECLRVFTRFPQTCKVFFGGGHDNGYASTLNSLNNEGLLDKVILLRGYKDVAFELQTLHLPLVEFEGVFMTQKLPLNHSKKLPGSKPADAEKRTTRSAANSVQSSPSRSDLRGRYDINTSSSVTKPNPPPCNFYYLAVCKAGTACRYGHDYKLDAHDLATLRVNAKKSPCGQANRNQQCPFGDQCPLGHMCPAGHRCKFWRAGKCKFMGDGMHDDTYDGLTPRLDRTYSISTLSVSTSGNGSSEMRPTSPRFDRVPLGIRISETSPRTPPSTGPFSFGTSDWNHYVGGYSD